MTRIRDVVQNALITGYLTIEAENQLRQLLATQYELEDFNAFMTLQQAAMSGQVKQEARERTVIAQRTARSAQLSQSLYFDEVKQPHP